MAKFVYRDDETGELIVRDYTEEELREMLSGFYELPGDDDD